VGGLLGKDLPKVIDNPQTIFIKGRGLGLLGSTLVNNKIVEECMRKKKNVAIVKVNFEKVYYLWIENLCIKLWIDWACSTQVGWIKECMNSVTISILVNTNSTQDIKLKRLIYLF